MTDVRMALAELLAKRSDSDLLREMIGYVAAGLGLRRWALRARLHRSLPRRARIAPASDA